MANNQYPDLHFVEDKILWYLVETKRNAYPEWLSLSELTQLLDFKPAIPLYAYILSYYLYSDGSLDLAAFAKKIFQEKPSPIFTGDFRVENPDTPFLLYTFKSMKDLTRVETARAADHI